MRTTQNSLDGLAEQIFGNYLSPFLQKSTHGQIKLEITGCYQAVIPIAVCKSPFPAFYRRFQPILPQWRRGAGMTLLENPDCDSFRIPSRILPPMPPVRKDSDAFQNLLSDSRLRPSQRLHDAGVAGPPPTLEAEPSACHGRGRWLFQHSRRGFPLVRRAGAGSLRGVLS